MMKKGTKKFKCNLCGNVWYGIRRTKCKECNEEPPEPIQLWEMVVNGLEIFSNENPEIPTKNPGKATNLFHEIDEKVYFPKNPAKSAVKPPKRNNVLKGMIDIREPHLESLINKADEIVDYIKSFPVHGKDEKIKPRIRLVDEDKRESYELPAVPNPPKEYLNLKNSWYMDVKPGTVDRRYWDMMNTPSPTSKYTWKNDGEYGPYKSVNSLPSPSLPVPNEEPLEPLSKERYKAWWMYDMKHEEIEPMHYSKMVDANMGGIAKVIRSGIIYRLIGKKKWNERKAYYSMLDSPFY